MKNIQIKRMTAIKPVKKGEIMQSVEVFVSEFDESLDVERHQNYGFSGLAATDANGLMLTVGGHRFVIALDHPTDEPEGMKPGDVQVWHKDGDYVRLTGGEIEVKTKHLILNARDTTIKGDLQVDGDANISGDCVASDVSLPSHTHPGDSGGNTDEPN